MEYHKKALYGCPFLMFLKNKINIHISFQSDEVKKKNTKLSSVCERYFQFSSLFALLLPTDHVLRFVFFHSLLPSFIEYPYLKCDGNHKTCGKMKKKKKNNKKVKDGLEWLRWIDHVTRRLFKN